MGELTREEVTARLEAVEARIDTRAQTTDSKIDALRNEMQPEISGLAQSFYSKIDVLRNEMEARAQTTDSKIDALEFRIDARMQKSFVDLIKWMVGTAVAMMAVGVPLLVFLFNNFTPRQPAHAPIVITVPAASAPATPR